MIAAFVRASLAAFIVAGNGCAPDGERESDLESELVNGTAARARAFPSVFVWTDGDDLRASYCTAAKIGPRMFITAAHCVLYQEPTPGRPYAGVWTKNTASGATVTYSFARSITTATREETLDVEAVHLAPSLEECLSDPLRPGPGCDQGRTPLPDVAVVELARATGSFARAPLATLSGDFVTSGTRITMLGYGSTRERDTSPPTLRSRAAEVLSRTALARALVGTEADVDGSPDDAAFFGALGVLRGSTYANLGSGDSGGPVFAAGTAMILGINADAYCPRSNRSCQRTTQSEFARIDVGSAHGVGEWLDELVSAR